MVSVETYGSVLGDMRSRQLDDLKNSRRHQVSFPINTVAPEANADRLKSHIRSPILSPVALDSESKLQARTSFSPFYVHEQARSRYLRTSVSPNLEPSSYERLELYA